MTCKLCGHAAHTKRCKEDAPNPQFTCACPGECAHGKHPHYCKECVKVKAGGKYFIRHRVTQHRADVELVIAPDSSAAFTAPNTERLGYWTDDSKNVEHVLAVFGPYDNADAARTSEKGWVEDV